MVTSSTDHLSFSFSLSKALFYERRFRRLFLWFLSATSPSISLIGDVSFGGSHRRHLFRWFSSRRQSSLSVALLKSKVCWFSSNLSLGGSSPRRFPSVAKIEAFTSN